MRRINRSLPLAFFLATAWLSPPAGADATDDRTIRPTVVVRQGNASGSGTVIASVPGSTLVLTAAHVVAGGGEAVVEVHRYNLGLERSRPPDGWPVPLAAKVVAADPAGDVAVLRVVGKTAMPFVAAVAPHGEVPHRGAVVRSAGIDGGEHLSSWAARVVETSWFVMEPVGPDDPDGRLEVSADPRGPGRRSVAADPAGEERSFLMTTRAPVEGRSGGGLFDTNGWLVGVCVGRTAGPSGRVRGVFASGESVRGLLRGHDLEADLARSDAYRAARQTPVRGAAAVAKPETGHHNTDRATAAPTVPTRADRARTGGPAHGRP